MVACLPFLAGTALLLSKLTTMLTNKAQDSYTAVRPLARCRTVCTPPAPGQPAPCLGRTRGMWQASVMKQHAPMPRLPGHGRDMAGRPPSCML